MFSTTDVDVSAFVSDHPRLAGLLVTTIVFLAQAGGAAAMCIGHGSAYPGP